MRLALPARDGVIQYVDLDEVYYFEAREGDTLVRTRRKRRLTSTETLGELEARLRSPAFFRCHRSFLVSLDRVAEFRRQSGRSYELKMEPPVNKIVPLSRERLAAFHRAMAKR